MNELMTSNEEATVTMTHEVSGKEVTVVNTPSVVSKYEGLGYKA